MSAFAESSFFSFLQTANRLRVTLAHEDGGCGGLGAGGPWFSQSCFTKSEDKLPKVPLLKYYTYNLGATAQVLSAGGPGLIAPGGTPGKIKLACTRRYGVTFWRQIRSS